MVEQVRRGLRHLAGSARLVEPSAFAAEATSLVVPAVGAAQAKKAVGQIAALEEGVELVFDELRQASPGCRLGLLEEGGGVLLHQAAQRGLLGAVALVVDRGAVWRPTCRLGLPANGLHARLPRW